LYHDILYVVKDDSSRVFAFYTIIRTQSQRVRQLASFKTFFPNR